MKNIQLNQNNFQKPSVNEGDYVKCTIEVKSDGITTLRNIYEGEVIEVFQDNEYLSYVQIKGQSRLIPIERVFIGKLEVSNV